MAEASLAVARPVRPWTRPGETAWAAAAVATAAVAAWFLFPTDLALLSRIAGAALFALSLYLVVGIGGVATLGHAVVYGAGAYGAGYACLRGLTDPFAMLAVGAACGALAGLAAGAVILRARGLTQLVLSIATVQLAHEAANKASAITGGSDGMSGIAPAPVLGLFAFDLYGRTGFVMGMTLLVLAIPLVGRIVQSPFGLACRAIKADEGRVRAMGQGVFPKLLALFTISGALGGVGGALSAVTTGVVGLDSVSFEWSASALVMIVLGGLGAPAGAVLGTAIFMIFEHVVSALSPFHWLALVGLLLIGVILFLPNGLISLIRPRRRRAAAP